MKVSMSRDFTGHLNSAESSEEKDGRKNVFVLGDSEWGISKQHSVKVRNFPGATTERINEEIDDILPSEPDLIIMQAPMILQQKLTLLIMSCPTTVTLQKIILV